MREGTRGNGGRRERHGAHLLVWSAGEARRGSTGAVGVDERRRGEWASVAGLRGRTWGGLLPALGLLGCHEQGKPCSGRGRGEARWWWPCGWLRQTCSPETTAGELEERRWARWCSGVEMGDGSMDWSGGENEVELGGGGSMGGSGSALVGQVDREGSRCGGGLAAAAGRMGQSS